MIQNHVNLLSGKVHAVPSRATATAADAAEIIRDMCLRSGDGFPDVLVVDHDPKFTSAVFRAFVKSRGSCLIVGSAYHKNTNAKVERANGVIGDTLRAYANGRKDDWDRQLPLAVFAINNAALTLGDGLTPFFINRGAHPRLPLTAPADGSPGGESPALYARQMRDLELQVRELLAAAQQVLRRGRRSWTRAGRHGVQGGRPGAAADQGAARRRGHQQAATAVGRTLHRHGLSEPQRLHARAPAEDAVQPYGERGPAQALPRSGRRPSGSGPGVGPGAGGRARGRAAAQPQD